MSTTPPENRFSGESLASSPDGRTFSFHTVEDEHLDIGAIVSMRISGQCAAIGQIQQVSRSDDDAVSGAGKIIGKVIEENRLLMIPSERFSVAPLVAAGRPVIELLQTTSKATLKMGTFLNTDITARLMPEKFNRHTFWCGQSGSGKSYALGVALEELLINTSLPLVILDPNADFVRITESNTPPEAATLATFRKRRIRVLRPHRKNTNEVLRARFSTMSLRAKAAVLRLDPLVDRSEYNHLLHLENLIGGTEPGVIVDRLRGAGTEGADLLASRIENLRLADWDVWARTDTAANEIIRERPDATVLDLGGFDSPDEALVIVLSVLDDLWHARESRRPALLVIDEAHNFCSTEQDSPLHRAVRERIIQIAAEGRKFGLWLLVSTQRPSRVDQSIMSQCDNLVLMKMSSSRDLEDLSATFGYVPPSMLARASIFRQGEAIVAGGFIPAPAFIKIRPRFTPEGGFDVRVPLRS